MTIEKRTTFVAADLASIRVACKNCKNEVVLKVPMVTGKVPTNCPFCCTSWHDNNVAAWNWLSKLIAEAIPKFCDNDRFGLVFETVKPIDEDTAKQANQGRGEA